MNVQRAIVRSYHPKKGQGTASILRLDGVDSGFQTTFSLSDYFKPRMSACGEVLLFEVAPTDAVLIPRACDHVYFERLIGTRTGRWAHEADLDRMPRYDIFAKGYYYSVYEQTSTATEQPIWSGGYLAEMCVKFPIYCAEELGPLSMKRVYARCKALKGVAPVQLPDGDPRLPLCALDVRLIETVNAQSIQNGFAATPMPKCSHFKPIES